MHCMAPTNALKTSRIGAAADGVAFVHMHLQDISVISFFSSSLAAQTGRAGAVGFKRGRPPWSGGGGRGQELQGDGVRTDHVVRGAGSPSPFTYIIVDRGAGTRTCIHTAGAPLQPADLAAGAVAAAVDGAAAVFFDGRLAEAALVVAHAARERGAQPLPPLPPFSPTTAPGAGVSAPAHACKHAPRQVPSCQPVNVSRKDQMQQFLTLHTQRRHCTLPAHSS